MLSLCHEKGKSGTSCRLQLCFSRMWIVKEEREHHESDHQQQHSELSARFAGQTDKPNKNKDECNQHSRIDTADERQWFVASRPRL